MNMADKTFNKKMMEITHTEKYDLGKLYYFYTIAFFLFFSLSFYYLK